MSDAPLGRPGARPRIFWVGVVLLAVGAFLFFYPVGTNFLGTSVSCGNLIAYYAHRDSGLGLSVCSGALGNQELKAWLALIAGATVLLWRLTALPPGAPRRRPWRGDRGS